MKRHTDLDRRLADHREWLMSGGVMGVRLVIPETTQLPQ